VTGTARRAAGRIVIVPYDERRQGEIAGVLGRAFADDPLYRWLWPDPRRRLDHVTAFVGAEVRLCARAGRVDVAVDGERRVQGAALWALPGRYPFPRALSARVMAATMPHMGLRASAKLPRLIRVDRAHPSEAHWYLLTLGVDPDAQQQGIGRSLIAATATQADRDGVPVYLETFKEPNLAYYQGLGFEQREHIAEAPLPAFWTMLRPSGGAPATLVETT
jgi:ribosomal protein S18 acetylase RimI-like enzyme